MAAHTRTVLPDQRSRRRVPRGTPVLPAKVVDLGKNQSGDDNQDRGRQDLLVLGKSREAVSRAGEAVEESLGVRDDRRTRASRSRKSFDSSPSLLSVDSKRRVDGERRPV